jgi:predicted DCC family thiol-disulfide oxidoreductase YuxK
MRNRSSDGKFRVYYDALCPLCSREIDYYRTKDRDEVIDWVDITQENFDATSEGLDPKKVHQFFHVKDEHGKIISGVDAFIEIWARIPSLRKWRIFSLLPGAKTAMKIGYAVFARVRPFLPRKSRQDCQSELCRVSSKEGT